MRNVALAVALPMLAALALGPWNGLRGQAPVDPSFGPSFFWGALCTAEECGEHVHGAGGALRGVHPLGRRVAGEVNTVFWYGSTRDVTVRRVSLMVAARVYPSSSAPVFLRAGGGVSWDLDEGPGHPAGLVGAGWEIRGWLGGTVAPFLDATFFGPPDPLPALRLISGGVELSWPF